MAIASIRAEEALATIGIGCLRCDHEFEVELASLVPGKRVPCPSCRNGCDPFYVAGPDCIVDEGPKTTIPPPPPPIETLHTACEGCGTTVEIIPDEMLGKAALCHACREAIQLHIGEGNGKQTNPFRPSPELLAGARRSSPPRR